MEAEFPFQYDSLAKCPNCGKLGQKTFTPIGDIVYNPIFTCGCGKSYEMKLKFINPVYEYIERKLV